MTFHLNSRDVKDKWLNSYKDEINLHREKMEFEKEKRIKEEQEYLNKVKRDMEEEKLKRIERKKQFIQENMEEYYKHQINKNRENMKYVQDKLNKDNVSLNLGYEERLEKMKERINQLSSNVDRNAYNYLKFSLDKGGDINDNNYGDNYDENEKNEYRNDYYNLNYPQNIQNNSKLDEKYGKNYSEYKQVMKNFDEYNKETMEDHIRNREFQLNEKHRLNLERIKDIQRLQQAELEDRQMKEYRQRIYRDLLDDQKRDKIRSSNGYDPRSRSNLSMSYDGRRKINNHRSNIANNITPLLYQSNPYVFTKGDINPNPYKLRNYNLGYTLLDHNTILNPVNDYKYNKYLFTPTGGLILK